LFLVKLYDGFVGSLPFFGVSHAQKQDKTNFLGIDIMCIGTTKGV